jgi:hypothetical protein
LFGPPVKDEPSSFYPEIHDEEVWLPSYVEAHSSARVLLFANAHGDYTSRFSDYKKFRVEGVIVSLKNKK